MTASGSCEICKGTATNYVSQLKVWRCPEHSTGRLSPEEKLKIVMDYQKSIEPVKKPKKSNSPFGKRYF
jgi:hypothetical protein